MITHTHTNPRRSMPKLLQTNSISIVNRRKHERIDLKRLPDTDYSWRAWKQKGKYLQG